MQRKTGQFAAALSALALVAVGCGGADEASTEEFEQEARSAQQQVEAAIADVEGAASNGDASERFSDAADELRSQAEELEEADAPEGAQDEQQELVAGMRQLADELDEASDAAREGGVRALVGELDRGDLDALERIQRAIEGLREEGFDVEQLRAR